MKYLEMDEPGYKTNIPGLRQTGYDDYTGVKTWEDNAGIRYTGSISNLKKIPPERWSPYLLSNSKASSSKVKPLPKAPLPSYDAIPPSNQKVSVAVLPPLTTPYRPHPYTRNFRRLLRALHR